MRIQGCGMCCRTATVVAGCTRPLGEMPGSKRSAHIEDFTRVRHLLVNHHVLQRADAPHTNPEHVHRDHRPDTLGRPRRNQVSRKQRHHLGNEAHYDVDPKNEIPCVALLTDRAIHTGFDANSRPGINFICNQWANWTEGIEAFCAGPLIVFVLQVTRGEIIYARITEDVRTNILFGRNFVAWLTDHDPEFSFVVRALRNSWPTNTASWGKQGRWRFQKDQRFGRYFVS